MDIWKHCLMSARKFGGQPGDYFSVHEFLDSSKLFYYHAKHRSMLHNLYGIELACERFHHRLVNSNGKVILVRDIAAEHCKEDLSGCVPTLFDWFQATDSELAEHITVPELSDQPELQAFVMRPYLRSGLYSSLLVTCSDFGIYLAELFLGYAACKTLADRLPAAQRVKELLPMFRFTQRWQYTPMFEELQWLKQQEELLLQPALPFTHPLVPPRSTHNGKEESPSEEGRQESRNEEDVSKKASAEESRSPKGGRKKGRAQEGRIKKGSHKEKRRQSGSS